MAAEFEALFHSSTVELLVPSFSQCPTLPVDPSSSKSTWWTDVQRGKARDVAFTDERLAYYVGMSIDDGAAGDAPSAELRRFLSHLQLSMSVSYLPPMLAPAPRNPADRSTLKPQLQPHGDSTPTSSTAALDYLPVTPMPQPNVREGEEQYAGVEGQVVWEGDVQDKYRLFRDGHGGWVAVWKGEVHVAYVRTQIQDPVLSLTASVTLREAPLRAGHKKGNFSIDTVSTRTAGDDYDEPAGLQQGGDGLARMRSMDLLGGLAGGQSELPATRLGQSLRHDLSITEQPSTGLRTPTAHTPTSLDASPAGPSRDYPPISATSTVSTLRKSFRRVLALSPGLRVRMRTIMLPQLLASPGAGGHHEDDDDEGEKRIVLCVEIENPPSASGDMSFEVESVTVDIGGKGGEATAELVCQPEQLQPQSDPSVERLSVFPLRLASVEQYNLLYAVSIASPPGQTTSDTADMALRGRGDDLRPAAITLSGRPFVAETGSDQGIEYPTALFDSRWNCQLDLSAFYASLSTATHAAPPSSNRLSKTLASAPPVPNAVAGDKRYSLASLASQNSQGGKRDSRMQQQRALMPSQAVAQQHHQQHSRMPSMRPQSTAEGLLISVKLLPTDAAADSAITTPTTTTVKPFEPFSIEVFVHNRTTEVRRFRLSVPPRQHDAEAQAQVRDIVDKRRSQYPAMQQDDPVLRRALARHLASAPAIVPLETDVRCGPLLPGASLAVRLRFMPLREGVHRVDKLVITGMGDDWNFVMSPVVDVIVGEAA